MFLGRRLDGASDEEAVSEANRLSGIKPRDWMRICLKDDTRVSFPVRGGASALKNHRPESWEMARESIRESARYASTLTTLYGRSPYYHLLATAFIPEIHLPNKACDVCSDSFRRVKEILLPDEEALLESLKEALIQKNQRIRSLRERLESQINFQLSIVDALVNMGPDAIFPLLPAF